MPPTLLISAIGVMKDIYKTISPEFKNAGDLIYILGEDDELGASEYYKLLAKKGNNNDIGNNVPQVDWKSNKKIYEVLENIINKELISSAISVNSGGLAIALAKASIGGMVGSYISIKNIKGDANTSNSKLFSESQGRIVVSVSSKNKSAFERWLKNIPYTQIGKVTKDNKFTILDGKNKIINTDIKKLSANYHSFSNKMK